LANNANNKMFGTLEFNIGDESHRLDFTEDALHVRRMKGTGCLYEGKILRKFVQQVEGRRHVICSPGGGYNTMLNLVVIVKRDTRGDPREVERLPPPKNPYHSYTDLCYYDEKPTPTVGVSKKPGYGAFDLGQKIPTGKAAEISIFQEYVIWDEREEPVCWDYFRTKEEDEMVAAKFEEMIDRIKMWGGVFYP